MVPQTTEMAVLGNMHKNAKVSKVADFKFKAKCDFLLLLPAHLKGHCPLVFAPRPSRSVRASLLLCLFPRPSQSHHQYDDSASKGPPLFLVKYEGIPATKVAVAAATKEAFLIREREGVGRATHLRLVPESRMRSSSVERPGMAWHGMAYHGTPSQRLRGGAAAVSMNGIPLMRVSS